MTCPGRCETIRNSERCGGSSIIFSNALALLRLRSSAQSTIETRQPPRAGRQMENPQRLAHVLDGNFGAEPLRAGLPLPPHQRKIRMRESGQKPRRLVLRVDMEAGGFAHASGVRIGVGEHEPRQTPGERRLADALGAADQPGMGEAAPRDRPTAFPPRRRCGRPGSARGAGCGAPGNASLSAESSPSPPLHARRSVTARRPDRGAPRPPTRSAAATSPSRLAWRR